MTLPTPNLDDRDFDQLIAEALRRMKQSGTDWNDLSANDPGMVLLDLFAYLTETTIYRLNRLPEKAYIEFLNLIGVRLQPPSAAVVSLQFTRTKAGSEPVEIPRGTRITVGRPAGGSEPPIFVTARDETIPPNEMSGDVLAYHCDLVDAEPVGYGSGLPGLSLNVQRPPIIAPTGDKSDLQVGVEVTPEEQSDRYNMTRFAGKTYRIWREVDNFTNLDPTDLCVYLTDRITGKIMFAPAAMMVVPPLPPAPDAAPTAHPSSTAPGQPADPAHTPVLEEVPHALAAIPPAGREIRIWYRRGGGANGNVAAGALTVLKDPPPGVTVTNALPASGGRDAEALENALIRGPQQVHSLQRAVTARDFEMLALTSSRAITRARAFTSASLWSFARPGTVEVLLVPLLPDEETGPGQVTGITLHSHDSPEVRAQIQEAIDLRRPMGINCRVNWGRYKKVRVKARIIIRNEESKDAIRQRVLRRLYGTISPLPSPLNATGWQFGQSLRASDVYDILLDEPGVRWADQVSMLVDEVPGQAVTTLAHDPFQDRTWYAGTGSILFRSQNNGDGWEPAGRFTGRQVDTARVHPRIPGLLAVFTQKPGDPGSTIHISHDCGETWEADTTQLAFRVVDIAWTERGDTPLLLMATDVGLYELLLAPGSTPVQVLVDSALQGLGFYNVVASPDGTSVAVAGENMAGVYISTDGGITKSFKFKGRKGDDIRRLAIQRDGARSFLWAGTAAANPDDAGKGCFRWELRGKEDPPEGWVPFSAGWVGGSVRALSFLGSKALAASHHAGVMTLDASSNANAWQPLKVNCGLPPRDLGRFVPVDTVVADDPVSRVIMAGGPQGVYISSDDGANYRSCSSITFPDKVTLPDTWLFVSGEHDLDVVSEDEAK